MWLERNIMTQVRGLVVSWSPQAAPVHRRQIAMLFYLVVYA